MPSISGASPSLRAMAVLPSMASTSTRIRRPTLAASRAALMSARLLHEAREPLFLNFRRHVRRDVVGRGAFDRRILECADAIELRLVQPGQQFFELGFGLAGEADDEGAANGEIRAGRAPGADALQRLLHLAGAAHALQHRGAAVLEGDVEVGQHLAVRPSAGSRCPRADTDTRSACGSRCRASPARAPGRGNAFRTSGRATRPRGNGCPRRRPRCPARSPGFPSRRRAPVSRPRAARRRSGRLTSKPRIDGMMQKLHLLLQPSEILRYA